MNEDYVNDLINRGNREIRVLLAKNQNLSLTVYDKLCSIEDYEIETALAENPKCPVEVLTKLADNRFLKIVKCVMSNPNTPKDLADKINKRLTRLAEKNIVALDNTMSCDRITKNF